MSEAIEKIEKYLKETEYRGEYDEGEYDEEVEDYVNPEDMSLMDKMFDFLMTLDPDTLDDEQFEMFSEIMDGVDDEEEDEEDDVDGEEVDEVKKVRRNKAARREAKKDYRKKKVGLKQKAKRWRKTAEYKRYQKKKKMMSKQGRTARGKKKKTFIE